MQTTVIDDMSNAAYHASPAISKSGLDKLAQSPLHYWRYYLDEDAPARKQTDAMTIGSAFHCLLLEPQNYEKEFATLPAIDRRTKQGKEEYAAFEEQSEGKLLVKKEDYDLCIKMASAVENHPLAAQYCDGFGKAEQSIFWQWSDDLPIDCRCRPDYIRSDGTLVDIKTSTTASAAGFTRKAYDFRYHVQAAFYREGFKAAYGEYPKEFIFIVVEKSDLCPVSVFRATDELIAAGMHDVINDLCTLQWCRTTNQWPGYAADQMIDLNLPSFARGRYEL